MAEAFGKQFQIVFEYSPIGIVIMDGHGRIQYANHAVVDFLRYEADELTGGNLARFSYEDDATYFRTLVNQLIGGERKEFQVVSRCQRGDGTVAWWRVDVRAVRAPAQSPFILGVIDDVTSQKQDEDQLRRAKELAEDATRTKSAFLANMSHEIRTPLHTINGMTELLRRTEMDVEQTEYVQQIQFAGEVLLGLINDILDFSKIEAGRLQLESIEFDLVSTLENAVDMVSIQAHRKGLETVLFIDPEVRRFMFGDPNRLRQVIVNLVNNAVKFTETGHIVVSAEIRRQRGISRLVVQVRDSGIGIAPERRDRLFQPFSQVDASMTRRFGGTGLGLSISRDLVEMMGGEIGVKSKENVGSNFWFSLPLDTIGHESAAVTKPTELPAGARVLIIDDCSESANALESYLREWGTTVMRATDARLGVEQLVKARDQNVPFTLCFVDLRLPHMDGWQLASEIRNREGLESQSLVLMSPSGISSGDAKMKLLGWFDGYINKPIKRSELAAVIDRVFSTDFEELEAVDPLESSEIEPVLADIGIPKTVLVAEDHFVNQQLFQTILEKRGFSVLVADDGLEALQKVKTEPEIGLIFMDVQMPNLNGFDATKRIRELGIETPIVAVTANALSGDRERSLEVGMDDYIAKPFKIGDIDDVVERLRQKGKFESPQNAGYSETVSTVLEPAGEEPRSEVVEASQPPIDVGATIEAFMGEVAIAERVIREFSDRIVSQIEQIRDFLNAGAIGDARILSHAIKGGAWNLNSRSLGDAAKEIEDACRDENAERALDGIPDLETEAARFGDFVHQFDFSIYK